MKMLPSRAKSLRDSLGSAVACSNRFLWGARSDVALCDLINGTSLGGRLSELAGRSVLILVREQLAAACTLIELDGVARRLVVCPPDVPVDHISSVIVDAAIEAIVWDQEDLLKPIPFSHGLSVQGGLPITFTEGQTFERRPTEWVLLTSGTTGVPKMVVHTLAGLTGAIDSSKHQNDDVVWSTFYDIRRYGGLQIFLRALFGRGSLILSSPDETTSEFFARLKTHSVTHISGTPSHWRRALMSPAARTISPRYVRLSGEVADQAILDNLRLFYPQASVGHAYASTEAGVGFEVIDGREGFSAEIIGTSGDVQLKVENGSLLVRSPRAAVRYVGNSGATLADAEGYVDTGDMVELRENRYYFLGRRTGVINVGGLKVHPEEVEAVINSHPAVRASLVRSRKSPITGALVVADVVLKTGTDEADPDQRAAELKREIVDLCREKLARHKIPASVRVVSALDVGAAGKLARHNA